MGSFDCARLVPHCAQNDTSFLVAGEEADLVEVVDVDGDGDVGGVTVIEEVGEVDFERDAGDDSAEARELEVLRSPDLEHERAEVFADERHFSVVEIDGVEVVLSQGFAEGIAFRREGVDEVKGVGEVSPENFFFEGGEAERNAGALLSGADVVFGLQVLALKFVGEPLEVVGGKIVAQEFDGVGVGQIKVGIGVESGEPRSPVAALQLGNQVGEGGDGEVGMEFYGLPEMLGGVVGSTVEFDALRDRIPVGENAGRNGWGGTPAVEGVFPFFLDGEKGVGIAGRSGFFDLREGLAEFFAGVGDEGLEGAFVGHGDDAALDCAMKEFSGQITALLVGARGPAAGLGVDVREGFGKGPEFDEAMQGESDGAAVFGDDIGGSDEALEGDLLGGEWDGEEETEKRSSICGVESSGIHRVLPFGDHEMIRRRVTGHRVKQNLSSAENSETQGPSIPLRSGRDDRIRVLCGPPLRSFGMTSVWKDPDVS